MQLDRKKLNLLLNMSDDQLAALIGRVATEAGINPAALGINPENLQQIRQTLGSADDADLEQINRIYEDYRRGHGGESPKRS